MLARDYTNVGSKGFILEAWTTEEIVGDIGSIGSAQDGVITISDKSGTVQAWRNENRSRLPGLGRKGRSPGEFMQPCQTALSTDSTVLAIADSGNNRVQLFDARTRKPVASVGTRGQIRPGRMQSPEGVVFVDGRCEMIVADTGNNRLQVFHVDMLAGPHDDLGIHAASKSSGGSFGSGGSGGSRTFEGLFPSAAIGNAPADTTTSGSRGTSLNSRSPVAWAQSQAPSPPPAMASSGRVKKPSPPQVSAEARGPGVRGTQEETPGDVGDASSRDCLLVFTGGEGDGMLRKRRTAGESEAAEGPLCQPCDLAYWRPRPPGRGAQEGHSSAWAWTPEWPPRWFRPHASHGFPGSSSPDDADGEEAARRELLPPGFDAHSKPVPSRGGDEDGNEWPRSEDESTITGSVQGSVGGGAVEGSGRRRPLLGAFLVRETGPYGNKLQLLFVAKTKEAEKAEAEKAEGTAANEEKEDPDNDSSDPALSEHASEEDDSEGLEWMKRADSGDGLGRRRGAEGANGSEAGSSSQHSSTTALPIFEVREETMTVLDDGTGVEIRGRVYDSLLSLLRGFRWGGFQRLVGVTDTRGDRGVVAVAERGGGRVRLLHYAPAFPPFYAAQLTHLHGVEGLRRPSSVSFSTDGDLLVVDQGARKVLVYSHLSGRWVRVREFGPDEVIHDEDSSTTNSGTDAPAKSPLGRRAAADKRDYGGEEPAHQNQPPPGLNADKREYDGGEPAHQNQPPPGPTACLARTVSSGERRGKTAEATAAAAAAAAGGGQEEDEAAGRAQEKQGREDTLRDRADWTPVSARFMRREVLGHVNGTTADLRSRLRRQWRLHPLTPGQLARRKLEFFQWGRSSTGEGLPGRGTSVDESGKQLCNQFLSNSSCSRPACPYSHDQPWVGAISDNSADACIVFRGGVTHAVNNLYGQVFGWEWEGELYRLFVERSFLRTMVTRRDPVTLGIHGAEAIRECEEKVNRVLDYPGFVDLATVVHEHVLGLRSWNQRRSVPAATRRPSLFNTRGTATSREDSSGERSPASRPLTGLHDNEDTQTECEGNFGYAAGGVQGQRSACRQGGTAPGGKAAREKEEIGMVAPAAKQRPSAHTASFEVETKPHLPLTEDSPPLRKLDAATPWLSWDFAAASNDAVTRETEHRSSAAAVVATIPTSGGEALHDGQDAKEAEPKDNGNNTIDRGGGDSRMGRKEEDDTEAEERKMNRTYGGDDGDHGASVNKLFAFQTDRVVRMLGDMF